MVEFRAEGGSPERFLNAASREKVNLWDISGSDGTITACVTRRGFKRLGRAAGAAGSQLVVVRKKGLPFLLSRYRRRKGILAGLLLFAGILYFFSCFIWSVEIHGNSRVSSAEITRALSASGIRPGAFRLTLNLRRAENQTLIRLPDLSWLTVNLRGSTAFVEVRERVYPPEVVPAGEPCNIRAAQTGQILSIEAYEGMALLKKGDSVKKGDIIVSGVIEEKTGVLRLVHAKAAVTAKTERTLSAEAAFQTRVQKETGKVVTRRQLDLVGWLVPLSVQNAPKGNYVGTEEENFLTLFGKKLPLGFRRHIYREVRSVPATLTKEQAAAKAVELLKKEEAVEFAGAKILSRGYKTEQGAAGVKVVGTYACIENIAYEEAILFS